jgi:hypothetical protein
MEDKCICNDEDLKLEFECVICKEFFLRKTSKWDRAEKCSVHHVKQITICGSCENVCSECEKLGWYSTAGMGGNTQHMNNVLDISKPLNATIRKNGCICDIDGLEFSFNCVKCDDRDGTTVPEEKRIELCPVHKGDKIFNRNGYMCIDCREREE